MNRKIVRTPGMISDKKEKIDHEQTDSINQMRKERERETIS